MAKEDREARLKRQLRANLQRRKARSRALAAPPDDPAGAPEAARSGAEEPRAGADDAQGEDGQARTGGTASAGAARKR